MEGSVYVIEGSAFTGSNKSSGKAIGGSSFGELVEKQAKTVWVFCIALSVFQ